MIISHKYRYLFIEIPLTGSWAIRNELVSYYDGQPILHKHANYIDFRRVATHDERDYCVFATVRNPLDSQVSEFFKYRTDHKGTFSNSSKSLGENIIDYADIDKYGTIGRQEVQFSSIFTQSKIWNRPYADMIDVSAKYLDYVIHFEKLQEGFAEVLRLLKITQVRPVPVDNETCGRRKDWKSYYPPEVYGDAKKLVGPFMHRWGYKFPPEWGPYRTSRRAELEFKLAIALKRMYLTNFRYSSSGIAMGVRRLHAWMSRKLY